MVFMQQINHRIQQHWYSDSTTCRFYQRHDIDGKWLKNTSFFPGKTFLSK